MSQEMSALPAASAETVDPTPGGAAEPTAEDKAQSARWAMWRQEIAACKTIRKDLIPDWSLNVDYRRAKPFATDSDQDRVQVTYDWAATKAKQAQLFSQVPEARLTHKTDTFKNAAPMFARKINNELKEARVGVAMDEKLPDCINAAGFGVHLIAYEAKTEMRDVPTVSPDVAKAMTSQGQPVPTKQMEAVLDSRYVIARQSPADFLWKVQFTGSDFDDSPWIGNSGRKTWSDATATWPKLTPEDKTAVCGGDSRNSADLIAGVEAGGNTSLSKDQDLVEYDQMFYWRHLYHPEETNYRAIHHLVFVKGKNEPVVDEPWKGQKLVPAADGSMKLRGARKFPLRVLTLTYLTDESLPPSDSAMGRPQVNELNRSRSQMVKNRQYSQPLRWFNVNLVDPQVQTQLMRDTWQGMIPMNGSGDKALGEISRAAYPSEDNYFDSVAKADLRSTWQIEDAVGEGPQIRSAEEARNRQSNFQTRIGYERARCAADFVSTAEVLAGLISLYGQFTPEELATLAPGMTQADLSDCFAYNVRADSTLLVDSEQRIERLMRFLNMTAKSGFVDVAPVIAEVAELTGLDPAVVLHNPTDKGPDPLNISMRLSGAADLHDPLVIAMLMKDGQLPNADLINQAKLLLASLQDQPTPPTPGAPGAPAGPGGPAPVVAPPAGAPPQATTGAPPAAAGPGVPASRGPRPAPYSAHPNWDTASRVEKRSGDGQSA